MPLTTGQRRLLSGKLSTEFQVTSEVSTTVVSPNAIMVLEPNPKPTPIPTSIPTSKLTSKPTSKNQYYIEVQVAQSIIGIDYNDFDTPAKVSTNGRVIVLAVQKTINKATSWDLEEKNIKIDKISSSARRKLAGGINVEYTITSTSEAPDAAKTAIQSALSTAAIDGTFVTNLQSARNDLGTSYQGTSSFTSITVTQPTVTVKSVGTPVPTLQPTESINKKKPSDNIGIIIGSVVAAIVVLAAAAFYYVRLQNLRKASDVRKVYVISNENNSNAGSVTNEEGL
jgi:hypothetical protein